MKTTFSVSERDEGMIAMKPVNPPRDDVEEISVCDDSIGNKDQVRQ